jgi:hypothetical protein
MKCINHINYQDLFTGVGDIIATVKADIDAIQGSPVIKSGTDADRIAQTYIIVRTL